MEPIVATGFCFFVRLSVSGGCQTLQCRPVRPGSGLRSSRGDDAVTEHGEGRSVRAGHREMVTDTAIADWSDRSVAYRGYDVLDLVRE